MKEINILNLISGWGYNVFNSVFQKIKHYMTNDYSGKHWKLRNKYLGANNKLLRYFYYIRIKRIESHCNADLGISYHDPSSVFKSRPSLPHGLNGIVISRKATIGKILLYCIR